MSQSKLRSDFGNLAVAWRVGFHTFADRCNVFYTFFILWLTGAMDSIKNAKLLSKTIETIKNHKKTSECVVPVNKNYKINAPGILVGPKSYGFGTTRSRDTRHLPNQ